jgi:hypothetical protein
MDVTLFFCKNANTDEDGQLNLLGVFNELYAPAFPARQDRLVIAGIIEWDRQQEGKIPFQIHLVDEAGKSIFTIEGHSEVDSRDENEAPAKTQLLMPIEKIVFPEAGRYRAECLIADKNFSGPSLYLMRSK